MHVHFVEGMVVRYLKPETGYVDAHLFSWIPKARVSFSCSLDNCLADKFGELVQFIMQGILCEQIVTTGIGLPGTALLTITMLVK